MFSIISSACISQCQIMVCKQQLRACSKHFKIAQSFYVSHIKPVHSVSLSLKREKPLNHPATQPRIYGTHEFDFPTHLFSCTILLMPPLFCTGNNMLPSAGCGYCITFLALQLIDNVTDPVVNSIL